MKARAGSLVTPVASRTSLLGSDVEADAYHEAARESEPTTRKSIGNRTLILGLVVLGVAACVVALFVHSSSAVKSPRRFGDDPSENQQLTDNMFKVLQAARSDSGDLQLTGDLLKSSDISDLFSSALQANTLVIQQSTITLDQGSNPLAPHQVVISGVSAIKQCSGLTTTGSITYSNGQPRLLFEFVSPNSEISFPSLYPEENLPHEFSVLPLKNTKIVLSSYDDGQPTNTTTTTQTTERGLMFAADLHLQSNATSNSSTPAPVVTNAFLARLDSLGRLVETQIAKLWGKLGPTFSVSVKLPDVKLGNTVKLTHNVLVFEKRDPVLNVTSVVVVTPPSVQPMYFDAQIDFTLAPVAVSLLGDMQSGSSWAFPGSSDDERLKLIGMNLNLQVVFHNGSWPTLGKGDVSCVFEYGQGLQLETGIEYPAADNAEMIAFEIMVSEDDSWGQLPAFPLFGLNFPALVASRTALVLSPVTGQHCFAAPKPPTTQCVQVVDGINVFSAVDFKQSAPIVGFPSDSLSASQLTVLLQGFYHKGQGFNASISIPDTISVIDPYITLSALQVSFFVPTQGTPIATIMTAQMNVNDPQLDSEVIAKIEIDRKMPVLRLQSSVELDAHNTTLPLVGQGSALIVLVGVEVVWNTNSHTTDVTLSGHGLLGDVRFDGSLHKQFGGPQQLCWDAQFDLVDKASITDLSQHTTNSDLIYGAGIAAEVASDVMSLMETKFSGLTLNARVFCHTVSVGIVLEHVGIFGDVFIAANFSRIINASDAVTAVAATALPTDENIQVLKQVKQLLSASFVDPFPLRTVGDFLDPLGAIISSQLANPMFSMDSKPLLVNASRAITALKANTTFTQMQLIAFDDAQATRPGIAVSLLPLASWAPDLGSWWQFGGGASGSLAPPTFPAIQTQQALLSICGADLLLNLALHIHTDDMDIQSQINVTSVVSAGLSFSFMTHPKAYNTTTDPFDGVLHWLFPEVQELRFTGSLATTHAWSLGAAVVGGEIDIDVVTLTNTVILAESAQPHLKLLSHAVIPLPESTESQGATNVLALNVEGDFGEDADDDGFELKVSTTAQVSFVFAKAHINVTAAQGSLAIHHKQDTPGVSSTLSYSFSVSGEVMIGENFQLSGSLSSSSADVLVLQATVLEEKPVTILDVISSVLGRDSYSSITAPSDMRDSLFSGVAFAGAILSLDIGAKTLSFNGRTLAFGGESDFSLQVSHTAASVTSGDQGVWSFVVGMAWAESKPFSSFAPMVTALDSLQIGPPALIFSTLDAAAVTFDFREVWPNTPQVTYHVSQGLGMFATLFLEDDSGTNKTSVGGWIRRWTGIEELVMNFELESLSNFEARAAIEGSLHVLPMTTMTELGVVLKVTPVEVSGGIESTAVFAPPIGGNVTLYGRVMAGSTSVSAKYASLTPWDDLLGVNGLTVGRCDMEGEITYEAVPLSLGVAGGLAYGPIGGSLETLVDLSTGIPKAVFKAELDDFVLLDLVTACAPTADVSSHTSMLLETGVRRAAMACNPTGTVVHFNGDTFIPGVIVKVDQLLILGAFNASASVEITSSGFALSGSMQPFDFFGIIDIGGNSPKGPANTPAVLSIQVNTHTIAEFKLDAAVSLFGLALGCYVDFSNQGITLDIEFVADLFNFTLGANSVGPLTHPTDFSVHATINDEVLDYLNSTMPQYVTAAKEKYNTKFGNLISQLESARSNLNSLNQQIDARRASDESAENSALVSLQNAQIDVAHAKQKVDSLQDSINDIENQINNLPWYDKWEAVPLGVEIAGLYTAKETADGALVIANEALKIAEAAVPHAQDLDPELDALVAAAGIANATIDAAEAALNGANLVLDNLLTIEQKIVQELAILFNPELISIGGSLAEIKKGDLAFVSVRAWLLGVHVEFSVNVDLSLAAKLGSSIWAWIAHRFGVDGNLSTDEFKLPYRAQ